MSIYLSFIDLNTKTTWKSVKMSLFLLIFKFGLVLVFHKDILLVCNEFMIAILNESINKQFFHCLVLMSNINRNNSNSYNPHEQKLLRTLNNL